MDLAGQAAGPVDLTQLSDKEVIRRHCENLKDRDVADELWRRSGEKIREALRRLVFSKSSLCPEFCDRKTFLDASFSRAWMRFFGSICKFRGSDSPWAFQAWLSRVAYTVALDEYRDVTGCRRTVWEISIEEEFPHEFEGTADEDTPVFHSGCSGPMAERVGRGVMAEPIPPPDAGTKAAERKFVIRELLVRYAQISEEKAHCARLIRLHYFKEWEISKIVGYVYGNPATQRQENTWTRYVYRDLADDYGELRPFLTSEFGIKELWRV